MTLFAEIVRQATDDVRIMDERLARFRYFLLKTFINTRNKIRSNVAYQIGSPFLVLKTNVFIFCTVPILVWNRLFIVDSARRRAVVLGGIESIQPSTIRARMCGARSVSAEDGVAIGHV